MKTNTLINSNPFQKVKIVSVTMLTILGTYLVIGNMAIAQCRLPQKFNIDYIQNNEQKTVIIRKCQVSLSVPINQSKKNIKSSMLPIPSTNEDGLDRNEKLAQSEGLNVLIQAPDNQVITPPISVLGDLGNTDIEIKTEIVDVLSISNSIEMELVEWSTLANFPQQNHNPISATDQEIKIIETVPEVYIHDNIADEPAEELIQPVNILEQDIKFIGCRLMIVPQENLNKPVLEEVNEPNAKESEEQDHVLYQEEEKDIKDMSSFPQKACKIVAVKKAREIRRIKPNFLIEEELIIPVLPEVVAIASETDKEENVAFNEVKDVNFESYSDRVMSINMYPNPARNYFNVELNGAGEFSIEVFDGQGRLVNASRVLGSRSRVDISNLDPGSYFVKTSDEIGSQVITKTLIVI